MSNKVPTEFASALEIGGPTPEGLIHLTFTRYAMGQRKEGAQTRTIASDGYSAEEIPVAAEVVPVATVMIPYPIFKKFGPMFMEIASQIEETQRKEGQAKAVAASKAQGNPPAED